ncbi:MAG: hypothetical protein JJE51_00265 [Thermoanaerobaculia bacterium]|nr:hypothetical protein [Thermoanaerobaculia bacterium]
MPLTKVVLLSFITLITMVNPLAVIPSFVTLTEGVSRRTRARVALMAALSTIVVLTLFLAAGTGCFSSSASLSRRFRSWAASSSS